MELVPIIYNSLFVVFSFLGIVFIFSFLYSRLIRSNRQINRIDKKEIQNSKISVAPINSIKKSASLQSERILNSEEKGKIALKATLSKYNIEQDSVAKHKVKIVNSTKKSYRKRSDFVQSSARYSVVNSFVKEKEEKENLYVKFSKMSVEYSQTY